MSGHAASRGVPGGTRAAGRARPAPFVRCVVLDGIAFASLILACSDSAATKRWACGIPAGTVPPSVAQIGCEGDFVALASEPLAASIPGARSVKTSIDREAGFALNFQ